MVTDRLWGGYDPKWRLEAGINKAHQKAAQGVVMDDDRSDWRRHGRCFQGCEHTSGWAHALQVLSPTQEHQTFRPFTVIWAK